MNNTDNNLKVASETKGNHSTKRENGAPVQQASPVKEEADEDALVHEEPVIPPVPDMSNEQDLDELTHTIPPVENTGAQEQDIDDLVHNKLPQQNEENY